MDNPTWLIMVLGGARGFLFATLLNLLWMMWLTRREMHDRFDEPLGVHIAFTELGAERLRAKGIEVPEPLPLVANYLFRAPLRRTRRWVVWVAPGTLRAIAEGVVTIGTSHMPLKTALVLREWEVYTPKPPRGNAKSPARRTRVPAFTPMPGFA